MSSFIATLVIFAALFGLSFLTKRRFGVLGLALAAGALLSLNWAATLTPFLEKQGIVVVTPPLSGLVQIVLIVAPALVLLFRGQTYTKMLPRIAGSLAFALLALTFLADILAGMLVLEGPSLVTYQFLNENKSILIVAGILGATLDLLLTRRPRAGRDGKKAKD